MEHVQRDLPPEVVARLLELHRFSTPDDLRRGVREALDWTAQMEEEIRDDP